jgi:hypothetical protein
VDCWNEWPDPNTDGLSDGVRGTPKIITSASLAIFDLTYRQKSLHALVAISPALRYFSSHQKTLIILK